MEHKIDPRKVMRVVSETNTMLRAQEVNNIEAMLGLQELVGRITVAMCTTPIQAADITDLCKKHLDDTVRIGFESKNSAIATV